MALTGESGLGKSTLLETLFQTEEGTSSKPVPTPAAERIQPTVAITPRLLKLTEAGVSLNLTIIDTPGFGDAVNNDGV